MCLWTNWGHHSNIFHQPLHVLCWWVYGELLTTLYAFRSLVFCVIFCRSLFVLLFLFFWPLCCLSFNLRFLITFMSSIYAYCGPHSDVCPCHQYLQRVSYMKYNILTTCSHCGSFDIVLVYRPIYLLFDSFVSWFVKYPGRDYWFIVSCLIYLYLGFEQIVHIMQWSTGNTFHLIEYIYSVGWPLTLQMTEFPIAAINIVVLVTWRYRTSKHSDSLFTRDF